jgi:hypothetical protein
MNWNPFRSYSRGGRGTSRRRTEPRRVKHIEEQRRCRVEQLEERMLLVVGATAIPEPIPAGIGYDGVVQIQYAQKSCSGSLLSSGRHVLTAAHCLTNNQGQSLRADATVIFTLIGPLTVSISVPPAMQHVHEEWNGQSPRGFDVQTS